MQNLATFSGVTILLSLTVFMNMVSEIMPNTSDAVPLIGNCTVHHLPFFSLALRTSRDNT